MDAHGFYLQYIGLFDVEEMRKAVASYDSVLVYRPNDAFVWDNLFVPAGMKNTDFWLYVEGEGALKYGQYYESGVVGRIYAAVGF